MRFINKKNSRPIVPIISLIDILAILLIYFILTSSPKEDKSFASITLPKASSLEKNMLPKARLELALTSDAKILLGSEEIPENQLTARLKQLKADKPDMGLELKADEN